MASWLKKANGFVVYIFDPIQEFTLLFLDLFLSSGQKQQFLRDLSEPIFEGDAAFFIVDLGQILRNILRAFLSEKLQWIVDLLEF